MIYLYHNNLCCVKSMIAVDIHKSPLKTFIFNFLIVFKDIQSLVYFSGIMINAHVYEFNNLNSFFTSSYQNVNLCFSDMAILFIKVITNNIRNHFFHLIFKYFHYSHTFLCRCHCTFDPVSYSYITFS